MLFRVGRCYAHGGVVTKAEPLTLLHAFAPAACVIEEEIARNAQLGGAGREAPDIFSHWGVLTWRRCSGRRNSRRQAGLYRPATADGGRVAADPDLLRAAEARAQRRLLLEFSHAERQERRQGRAVFGGPTAGYDYTADVILALCEGPISGIGYVWRDQSTYTLVGTWPDACSTGLRRRRSGAIWRPTIRPRRWPTRARPMSAPPTISSDRARRYRQSQFRGRSARSPAPASMASTPIPRR